MVVIELLGMKYSTTYILSVLDMAEFATQLTT